LYSERDIVAIRWIREQTSSGQGVREAIAMVETALADADHGAPQADAEPARVALLDAFIAYLATPDFAAAQASWDDLALTVSAPGERILLPALRATAPGNAAALAFLQRKAMVLLDAAEPDTGEPDVAIAIDGGTHAGIAAMVLAATLARAGFRVHLPIANARDTTALTSIRRLGAQHLVLAGETAPVGELIETVGAVTGQEIVVPWSLADVDVTGNTLAAFATAMRGT
jgi:hypothetical protein